MKQRVGLTLSIICFMLGFIFTAAGPNHESTLGDIVFNQLGLPIYSGQAHQDGFYYPGLIGLFCWILGGVGIYKFKPNSPEPAKIIWLLLLIGLIVSQPIASGMKDLIYSQRDGLQAVEYFHQDSYCKTNTLLLANNKETEELYCQFTFENPSSKPMEFEAELLFPNKDGWDKDWSKDVQATLPKGVTPKIDVYLFKHQKVSQSVSVILTGDAGNLSAEWTDPQIRISNSKQQLILGGN